MVAAEAPPAQAPCPAAAQNIVPAGSLRVRSPSRAPGPSQGAPEPASPPTAAAAVPAAATEPALPLWVALSDDAVKAAAQQPEAVLAGLKALRVLGVWGVTLDAHWAAVEPAPRQYTWAAYRPAIALAREAGLKLQVNFCFHSDARHALPAWVLDAGEAVPDIFYTDAAGARCLECLSLGVDDVPVLAGRTAVQCYSGVISSFASDHAPLLASVVTDARVGLGPGGELRYPSHPADGRWAFPGVGAFQCYDAFMLSGLAAAASAAGQPHWGTGGPHDAGGYGHWPHQTGFFHHTGSWGTEYGRFFSAWYSGMLARHADRVLGAAAAALGGGGARGGAPVRLHAALPVIHWWHRSAARAAELTAGYCGRPDCDAYLPAMLALARHGARAHLACGELTDASLPPAALASPEGLLTQLRGAAAAAGVPVTLANGAVGFRAASLGEVERKAFECGCYQGVDVPPVARVVLAEMGDAMFEPAAWTEFREWAARVRQRAAALGGAPREAAPQQAQHATPQQQQPAAAAEQQQQQQRHSGQQPMPPPQPQQHQQQPQPQQQPQQGPAPDGAGQWQVAVLV